MGKFRFVGKIRKPRTAACRRKARRGAAPRWQQSRQQLWRPGAFPIWPQSRSEVRQIVKNPVNRKGRSGDANEVKSQHAELKRRTGQDLNKLSLPETNNSHGPAGAQRQQLCHELAVWS